MTDPQALSLEQCIAQKLMPDIRFFDVGQGREPVLRLSDELIQGLAALQPCGVILFAENLRDIEQCVDLCADLQRALAPAGPGALIGIDQEGGRVTRLPRSWSTGFSGNMALAACDPARREVLARRMAAAQARELAALGININFVPSLDVNSNPDNTVIQVRSFGDDPAVVAALGSAVIEGTQGEGLAAAAKHFPGHGDTAVDSHTGLPRVERDRDSAMAVDLAPFAGVFHSAPPDMVMTAHIQYPCLDDSCLPGTDLLRPATLSPRIVDGVLRGELGYDGVVITDALDMRAISDRFTPSQAALECFRAGVDIALMPLLLRQPADFERLQQIVQDVAAAVRAGDLDEQAIRESAGRILRLRLRRRRAGAEGATREQRLQRARACLASDEHLALEREIAAASLTLASGELPRLRAGQRVHLLLPDEASAAALGEALSQRIPELVISSACLATLDPEREQGLLQRADMVLVGIAEPGDSGVVLGGAEDLGRLQARPALERQLQWLQQAGSAARVAWLMRSPYPARAVGAVADCVLASYDGAPRGAHGGPGPALNALADALCGLGPAQGRLPVRLPE